jgi:formylglycine-generating enzyme required for sulfatase activity
MRRALLVGTLTGLALSFVVLACGQDGKPWERPGANAGDTIAGPDGGKMVWVPAGQFTMGSPDAEGQTDEHPQHQVRITKGFWLSKSEVSNEQYTKFLNEVGVAKDDQGHDYVKAGDALIGVIAGAAGWETKPGQAKRPMECVSWFGAKGYCEHYGLALATEAQWEYAARGAEGRRYPWGNDWDSAKCCSWEHKGAGDPPSVDVGSLPDGDSWCGASDMAGNVTEWCADWYDPSYYAQSPPDDPVGPGKGDVRVARGGSWDSPAQKCRSMHRTWYFPDTASNAVGFRPCLVP